MIRIDTVEAARRWVDVYVDGEPPEFAPGDDRSRQGQSTGDAHRSAARLKEGIDGPGLIPAHPCIQWSLIPDNGVPAPHGAILQADDAAPNGSHCASDVSFHAAVDLDLTTNTGGTRVAASECSPRAAGGGEPRGAHTHGDLMRAK